MEVFDKNRFAKAMSCPCPWGGKSEKRQSNKGKQLIQLFFQDLSYFRWMMDTAKKDSKWLWLSNECKLLIDGLNKLPKNVECLNCNNKAEFLSLINGRFTSFAYICCNNPNCKKHLNSIATSHINFVKIDLMNLIYLSSDRYYQKDLVEYLKEAWGIQKRFNLTKYKKDILEQL